MYTIRIIPRLDIKGPNLVKGIHLEGLRVLGKPRQFAQRYYEQGADEIIYIDCVASLYGRENLLHIVRDTAENIFIPLTAGGGVRTLDDIRNILRAGADKVAINTAATKNPHFIREAVLEFGSQCIVLYVEAKLIHNTYMAFTDNGREPTGRDVFEWVQEVVSLGAGEVLLTSIDRDGTGLGYDIQLIRSIANSVPVSVIAHGGAGRPEHFLEVVKEGRADAVSAASLFHYYKLESINNQDEYKDEGNIEFIKMTRGGLNFMSSRIKPTDIVTVKSYLVRNDIACRLVTE